MPMLLFMPWCRIDKAYQLDDIVILPFERHKPIQGLDAPAQGCVGRILADYKDLRGEPVESAALAHHGGRSVADELTEEEVATAYELVALACFSGLAKRQYFHPIGPYCNSDCFTLYVQRFTDAEFTAFTTRRREGTTLSGGWRIGRIAITMPAHCHTVSEVTLDEALLGALVAHRGQSRNGQWGRWQSAISCFNWANTDSDSVRYQMEWVLLCSAFEHLLEAKSEAKDVASRFSNVMVPGDSLIASQANRRSDRWTDAGTPMRYEWMREFYRIRGDFAHGKLDTQQPAMWTPLEHLVLATIAFPLVVKYLLSKVARYNLTDQDEAEINSFERFADTRDFLQDPPDTHGSGDSHWKRLVDRYHQKAVGDRAFKEAWSRLTPEGRTLLGEAPGEDSHDP